MSFPLNPTNGQQTQVNGVVYTYSSAKDAWTVGTLFVGNVTVDQINANSVVSAGNVSGTNLNASTVSATGNISGSYILGNGSQLTGLPEGYTNANVAAYLPTYTGNLVSLTGNVTTTATVSATGLAGNLVSANAVGTNQIANSAVTAAKLSSTAVTDSLGYTPVNRAGDTMTGSLTVNASGMVFESRNADAYSRFTASNGSAQVGLFRSGDSAGGFYIGGDATSFKVYNSSFTPVLLADSSGRVTMPYQPLFSASDTRALNITDAVLTSSNCFDSIDYNVGSHFNAATGRFTVPIAGFYDCSFFCADVSASGKDTNMRIRKNGVANTGPLAEAYNQAGLGATNVSVRCVIQCAVGDYIDFQAARLNTVGSIQHKRFIIHLLG